MEKTALISFGVGIAAASAGFVRSLATRMETHSERKLFREISQNQQAKAKQEAMDRAIAAKKREADLDLQRREHRPLQQADGAS